ncbi:NUDIX hydrolase [Candidatus Uhrbacteria bacterium]|nr:NUDIX hydrolase [Candidatus Uhrbacteria bacterium]
MMTYVITTAAILIDAEGRVLLGKRSPKEDTVPGFWSLPAGKLESFGPASDVLEDNLKRELREEIGIEITDIRYLDSHMWTDREPPKITIVFTARIASGEPTPLDPQEVTDVKWWAIDEALRLPLPPHVARVLEKTRNAVS